MVLHAARMNENTVLVVLTLARLPPPHPPLKQPGGVRKLCGEATARGGHTFDGEQATT